MLLLFLLTILQTNSEAARILAVYPTPCISHQVVFRPLTLELLKRGHEVVVITTDPMFTKSKPPNNLTEIDLHDISYSTKEKILKEAMPKTRSPLAQIFKITELFSNLLEIQMKTKEFQKILKNNNTSYDLLIIEAWVRPMLILSHLFQAPVVQISSFGGLFYNYETLGVPIHPIRFPTIIHQKIYNHSLWDKMKEVHTFIWFKIIVARSERSENAMLKRIFGNNIPSVAELSNNVDLLLINHHPLWAGNVPVPPNVIYIGGIYKGDQQAISKDLDSFINSTNNGFIYFSLGTNVKSSQFSTNVIRTFVKVFSRLPYNVLWKWDDGQLPEIPKNIKISNWFPQSTLLNHPKIKLFITHGGLQSTEEAIDAGVPLIGIPFYGDQWYNVEKYVQFNVGMKLDIDNLTEEKLYETIMTVIEDKSFRQSMVRLRSLMKDQPQCPLERAAWWTEHVLRQRGANHLRSPTANITWTEYLEIELVSVITLFSLTISITTIRLLKHLTTSIKCMIFKNKYKSE